MGCRVPAVGVGYGVGERARVYDVVGGLHTSVAPAAAKRANG